MVFRLMWLTWYRQSWPKFYIKGDRTKHISPKFFFDVVDMISEKERNQLKELFKKTIVSTWRNQPRDTNGLSSFFNLITWFIRYDFHCLYSSFINKIIFIMRRIVTTAEQTDQHAGLLENLCFKTNKNKNKTSH